MADKVWRPAKEDSKRTPGGTQGGQFGARPKRNQGGHKVEIRQTHGRQGLGARPKLIYL